MNQNENAAHQGTEGDVHGFGGAMGGVELRTPLGGAAGSIRGDFLLALDPKTPRPIKPTGSKLGSGTDG